MVRREGREAAQDSQSYYHWQVRAAHVRGEAVTYYTKLGMLLAGELDPAAALLGEVADIRPADTVLVLNSGTGLTGVVAARLAASGHVHLADGNALAVEATRRTLAANGVTNATVYPSVGTAHLPGGLSAAVALIRLPKGRLPALQLLRDAFYAVQPGGRIYLAGGNDEGIKTYLGSLAELCGEVKVVAYRRGHRVGVARRPPDGWALPDAFTDPWLEHGRYHRFAVAARGKTYTICSRPGIFSWDRLDPGSAALLETMQVQRGESVLDLGCGYGILGAVAAELVGPQGCVYLLDAEVCAVEAAQRTLEANNITNAFVCLGDCAQPVEGMRFDVVVTNPPFHQGKGTTYDIALQFVRDAARLLRPGGRLYLVANRFIPYEEHVRAAFGAVKKPYEDAQFKVLSAVRADRSCA